MHEFMIEIYTASDHLVKISRYCATSHNGKEYADKSDKLIGLSDLKFLLQEPL